MIVCCPALHPFVELIFQTQLLWEIRASMSDCLLLGEKTDFICSFSTLVFDWKRRSILQITQDKIQRGNVEAKSGKLFCRRYDCV